MPLKRLRDDITYGDVKIYDEDDQSQQTIYLAKNDRNPESTRVPRLTPYEEEYNDSENYYDMELKIGLNVIRYKDKDVYIMKTPQSSEMYPEIKAGNIQERNAYYNKMREIYNFDEFNVINKRTGGGKNKYKININKQTNFIYVLVDNKKVYLYKDENNKLFITLNKKVKFINKKQIKRDSASNIYINV